MAEQRVSQEVTEFLAQADTEGRVSQDVTEFLSLGLDTLTDTEFRISQEVTEYLYLDTPGTPEQWLSQDVTEYLFMGPDQMATVDCNFGSACQAGVLKGQGVCE